MELSSGLVQLPGDRTLVGQDEREISEDLRRGARQMARRKRQSPERREDEDGPKELGDGNEPGLSAYYQEMFSIYAGIDWSLNHRKENVITLNK